MLTPLLILGAILVLMIFSSILLKHIRATEQQEFDEFKKTYDFPDPLEKHCEGCEFYNEYYNMCEHNWYFGYITEHTIFECENDKE